MKSRKYLALFLVASITIAVPAVAQAQEATDTTVYATEQYIEESVATGDEEDDTEILDGEEIINQTESVEDSNESEENQDPIEEEDGLETGQTESAEDESESQPDQQPEAGEIVTDPAEDQLEEAESSTESVDDLLPTDQTDAEIISAESAKLAELIKEGSEVSASTTKGARLPDPTKPVYKQDAYIHTVSANNNVTEESTIVPSPVIKEEFRFWTVAKEPAIAKKKLPIREEMKSNSRTIGILPEHGICYILSVENDGWIYVESGTVRGFVREQLLYTGAEASLMKKTKEAGVALLSPFTGESVEAMEAKLLAEEKVPALENDAFTFLRTTVYQSVVEKDPALAVRDLVVYEEQGEDAREIGTLKAGGLCYVIADRDKDWVYVESGDVRGFVKSDELLFSDTELNVEGKTLKDQIEERGETTYALASEQIPAKENEALYYTMTSVRSGVPGSTERESILSYAAQFIGNPYVWGGTDPVHGADCSGFVQTVYKQFGYSLPRTAAEQAQVGEKIPVENAQPGDLIFYGNGERIYHVVIYAGDNQTLEAKGRKYGIVSDTVSQKNAAWAIRVIDDDKVLSYDIPGGLGQIHTFMGWQKVTNVRSQQYAFRESAGMTFDPEGFAVVDNRYVIACTDTFGQIGDYIDFYQDNGTKIPCVIGDLKNQSDIGCNEWGHMNGKNIVEFVVDQNSWYGTGHANPGTASCHPEWGQEIVRAEKTGSFYDDFR